MFTISFDNYMIELKDGAIKNVGPTNKSATAKLFDVSEAEIREFGDKRVKLVFNDDEGNHVQISLFPEHVHQLVSDIDTLKNESTVFE